EGRDGVLLKVLARMRRAEPYVGVRRQMKHDFGAPYALVKMRQVEDVSFDEMEIRMFHRFRDELPPTSGEIVVTHDRMPLFEESIDEIAADKSGSAGDKSAHIFL